MIKLTVLMLKDIVHLYFENLNLSYREFGFWLYEVRMRQVKSTLTLKIWIPAKYRTRYI